MTNYTVGLKTGTRNRALTIEAEDALVAALKSKLENPEAQITYVRKVIVAIRMRALADQEDGLTPSPQAREDDSGSRLS